MHPSIVVPYLQDGDVILRMTDGFWSALFSRYSPTDQRFSHLGIVRVLDDDISVVHSIGSFANRNRGVEEVPLRYFIAVARSLGIFRVRGAEGAAISSAVMRYIGRPFDFDFDLDDDSTIYCTQLLYVALRPISLEHILSTVYVEQIGRHVIPLDAISNSPVYIEEVAFFVRQNRYDAERNNLAWYRRILLSILSHIRIRL